MLRTFDTLKFALLGSTPQKENAMIKCVRIRIEGRSGQEHDLDALVKQARKLAVEGSAQRMDDDTVRIVACGERDAVEAFVDGVHRTFNDPQMNIFVEPFLKDRDYRGVFRIIE